MQTVCEPASSWPDRRKTCVSFVRENSAASAIQFSVGFAIGLHSLFALPLNEARRVCNRKLLPVSACPPMVQNLRKYARNL